MALPHHGLATGFIAKVKQLCQPDELMNHKLRLELIIEILGRPLNLGELANNLTKDRERGYKCLECLLTLGTKVLWYQDMNGEW